ncbi:uncharacterized protein BXIN_1424 [Babesia sp. Xinjiang]|uniref:uncharacterized protein n=1 Tax=Babesia sp. Xinjiang TaxID=462227 RepID=UPI000A258ABD|nr:uncharacterized protein BXIN_1424 [Babesia sp. Xinjiang]ORM39956.1 hypothetical protein BXIN_1424 [Babesia sp. Xinjiang]
MFGWTWLSRLKPFSFLKLRLPFDWRRLEIVLPRLRLVRCLFYAFLQELRQTTWMLVALALLTYYELFHVALVCPYFTGDRLSPRLNRFATVGKTYRPTFYLFAPFCQWLYLISFCKLNRCYRVLVSITTDATSRILSMLSWIASLLMRMVMTSFLFKRLFRGQAEVAIREFLEGHNGALVVLDYYLPQWVGGFCSKCGKYSMKGGVRFQTDPCNTNKQDPKNSHYTQDNANVKPPIVTTHLESSINTNYRKKDPNQQSRYKRNDNKNDRQSNTVRDVLGAAKADCARKCEPGDILEQPSGANPATTNNPEGNGIPVEPPPQKLLRGVIAIIGDVSVPYSICNQNFNCRCDRSSDEEDTCLCQGCGQSKHEDKKGVNIDAPGHPTIRYLISDAMEIGFACVQVHLNVNLGMASEAFPTWTGLRCFPLSLYSDALIDLDCALKRISLRYPNLPLCCLGFGYGSNILMEYLSFGSAGKAIRVISNQSADNHWNMATLAQRHALLAKRRIPMDMYDSAESFTGSEYDSREARRTEPFSQVCIRKNSGDRDLSSSATGNTPKAYVRRTRQSQKYTMNPAMNTSSKFGDKQFTHDNPNYESFMYLHKVIGDSNTANASSQKRSGAAGDIIVTPTEGHFQFEEESDECTYETTVVYPPAQQSEVIFDVKRISAVACVNLNMRISGNTLYQCSYPRKSNAQGAYARYCYSALKHHLISLFREVHCSRKNDNMQKECCSYRCCHYIRSLAAQPLSRRLLSKLRKERDGFHTSFRHYRIEQLLLALHREYRSSYRHMRRRTLDEYVNYTSGIFRRFGARSSPDFKLCALMTSRYVYSHVGHDGKNRIESVSGDPTYKLVNKYVDTNIRIGRANLSSGVTNAINKSASRSNDPKIHKYLAEMINREYTNNIINIRRNFAAISLPTLLLSSLNSSQFTIEDVDIFDVVRNPNIVHYVCKSGGYGTFLSGFCPAPWFSRPLLEFLDEMSNHRVFL